MMRTRVSNVLLYIMVTSFISCHVYKNSTSPVPGDKQTEEVPRIMFLDYQVSRDALNETYLIKLISMIVVNGTIKEQPPALSNPVQGDLELQVLNGQQEIITRRYIADPLDRSVEYANDNGQFERRMVHLDSAQFNIRLQVEPGAGSIVIRRFIDEKEGILLLQSPIQ